MPTGDKPQILQVAPGTLQDRLTMAVGNPATVYVMGVHADQLMGPTLPMPSPFRPGMPRLPGMPGMPGMPGGSAPYAIPAAWCPPGPPMPPAPPCPGPGPLPPCPPPCPPPAPAPMMMGTAVVNGILAFAGADYMDMHVAPPNACPGYMEVLIPYNSVGMVLPGGPSV